MITLKRIHLVGPEKDISRTLKGKNLQFLIGISEKKADCLKTKNTPILDLGCLTIMTIQWRKVSIVVIVIF